MAREWVARIPMRSRCSTRTVPCVDGRAFQRDVTAEVHKREAIRRDQHRILMMIQGGQIGTWEMGFRDRTY